MGSDAKTSVAAGSAAETTGAPAIPAAANQPTQYGAIGTPVARRKPTKSRVLAPGGKRVHTPQRRLANLRGTTDVIPPADFQSQVTYKTSCRAPRDAVAPKSHNMDESLSPVVAPEIVNQGASMPPVPRSGVRFDDTAASRGNSHRIATTASNDFSHR